MMCRSFTKLFLLPILAISQSSVRVHEIPSERIDLIEIPAAPSTHEYTLTLPDRLRSRHFAFELDRSVCPGPIIVNGQKLTSDDADEIFAFDRANRISVASCLERTPAPLALYAHPKVLIESGSARLHPTTRQLRLDFRLRNTLANSVSVYLSSPQIPSWEPSFFLPPESSQTHTQFVRLTSKGETVDLLLTKLEEAVEGPYRHIRSLRITR
jgi:hypothetical protein